MAEVLERYPDIRKYLDDTEGYRLSIAEVKDRGQRLLIVTQRGPVDGGQMLFSIDGEHLVPRRIGTVLDISGRRPQTEALDEALRYDPAPGPDVTAVAAKMAGLANDPEDDSGDTKFSTASGPDGGNLACVWAVRHLARKALGRWITRTDSTSDFADELLSGYGQSFKEAELPAGSIVISPTEWHSGDMHGRHGHVGMLGTRQPDGSRPIFSNSSLRARWEKNFTVASWRQRYVNGKGLKMLFFPIPGAIGGVEAPVASLERLGEAIPRMLDGPAELEGPDALAGEAAMLRRDVGSDSPSFESAASDLPIGRQQALKVAKWMKQNFGGKLTEATSQGPFSVDHLCGIVCQETAYFWVGLIGSLSPQTIVERCVLDASGDFPGTDRSAFPVNTSAFRQRFGDEFTTMLINEANKTRALRHYGPKPWVYKGYGLFQYDLQYAEREDTAFFRERRWYDFDACLNKAMTELRAKYDRTHDVFGAIRAYNGSGPRAVRYANNVMQFTEWCSEVPMV